MRRRLPLLMCGGQQCDSVACPATSVFNLPFPVPMNINILPFVVLCLSSAFAHAEETRLFRMTGKSGQPEMVFQEVERADQASTVEASFASGSAVAKSLFMLRASCALMRARDKQAFRIVHLARQPVRMRIDFIPGENLEQERLDQPLDEGSVISAARCTMFEAILNR